MGILRELGPVLAAVVIAGRSGSALAAELAGMRISEELDALESLGIDLYDRLVIPRVIGLTISTPLLTAVADMAGLIGGTYAIQHAVNLRMAEFLLQMPSQVPLAELTIGIGKAFAFGAAVSTVSCYYGLRSRPDTTSLATHTTAAVVTSIVCVLLLDAAFAILLTDVG
jgi:phospholipid/cholesterol/gamma-HCH transport system permease protein